MSAMNGVTEITEITEITGQPVVLEVRNLSVSYGKVEALHGIDLKIRKGEIVTVIGPNGAGKTTLLCALMGLLPARGDIVYLGERQGEGPRQLRGCQETVFNRPARERVFRSERPPARRRGAPRARVPGRRDDPRGRFRRGGADTPAPIELTGSGRGDRHSRRGGRPARWRGRTRGPPPG